MVAAAPQRYATPLGLALRLQRGPIIGWTLTVALSALMFGSVVQAMTDLLDDAGGSVPTCCAAPASRRYCPC